MGVTTVQEISLRGFITRGFIQRGHITMVVYPKGSKTRINISLSFITRDFIMWREVLGVVVVLLSILCIVFELYFLIITY